MMNYDVMIVGAGIAGLHCAMKISQRNPRLKIAIAEAYNYVGGRCFTYKHGAYQWESGAGRIHSSHTIINNYVKKYKLTTIPLTDEEDWIGQGSYGPCENNWKHISQLIHTALSKLQPSILATHTIQELMDKAFGKESAKSLLERFAYNSEIATQRADVALRALKNEMGYGAGHFAVIKKGFGTLMQAMRNTLQSRGVEFLLEMRLCAVEPNTTPIVCKFSKEVLTADKVILAVPSEALKKISPFANLPALKHIQMTPLLRTYGVFKSNAEAQPWFADLHKSVTDSPLKFIIPVNASKGVIMTSYTDGEDTKPWAKILAKGEPALKNAIMTETRKLFPTRTIPQPIFFKAHLWKNGCSYWTPGLYDPVAIGNKIMNPWENLYVCGESYSQRQAWVEGALEHADALIHKFFQKL